jgi:hypothetical protein
MGTYPFSKNGDVPLFVPLFKNGDLTQFPLFPKNRVTPPHFHQSKQRRFLVAAISLAS